MFQRQSQLLTSCISIWWSTWAAPCQQDLLGDWAFLVSQTWWQQRHVSHQPMEPSIVRQGEQGGREEGFIWAQHMHFPVGRRGRRGRREARYGVTLLESVIWHRLCVWVCQRAGEGFWGHCHFLLSPSLWVLSKRSDWVAEQHDAHWRWSALNGCWMDVNNPGKSVLFFYVGRGEPTDLKGSETGSNQAAAINSVWIHNFRRLLLKFQFSSILIREVS